MDDALWQQLRPLLPDGCTPSDSLRDDLGLDSLSYVELIMQVEGLYDIYFPDDELSQMHTVLDLVQGVKRHLSPAMWLLIHLNSN
ncbi:acyl carrier protein [Hymenobacter luteus]|uniref:Acyl carrier protein n=2 Tax=Hymenobacter TaxID=89966 RepID=A0A7W9T5K6_9BACT|nr:MULTISPECIES: acyl carrier protein [Hymenobacter]MBB4603617.1 acyl carrier protein [Hymenobacter latericoloratus]MBB6061365.1 acyl carrier protein [Hymenobacter luteus]